LSELRVLHLTRGEQMPDPAASPTPDPDEPFEMWVHVRSLSGDSPGHVRARMWLKAGLRGYRLRCDAIRGKPPDDAGESNVANVGADGPGGSS
jgi:hypothetical protein